MLFLVFRWAVLTMAILAASHLIPGIFVRDFASALAAAAVLGVLNVLFRPLLLLLTLPLNVLTLGLFTFIINAFLLMMVSGVISGFVVRGFGAAVLGAVVISVVGLLFNLLAERGGRPPRRDGGDDVIELRQKGKDRWE
jgi:putative membrane protein